MLVVIAVKGGLFAFCRKHARLSPSVEALMDDHRNDVLSNGVGMVLAKLGALFWVGLDPLGAILVTLYIMHVWFGSALEQARLSHDELARADGGRVSLALSFTCRVDVARMDYHHHPSQQRSSHTARCRAARVASRRCAR